MSATNGKPSLKLDTNTNQMPPPAAVSANSINTPKPILKLNPARQNSIGSDGTATPSEKKILKIKVNSSQPPTPATATAARAQTPTIVKTKAGRATKPTAKLTESKKRAYESDDEDVPLATIRTDSRPPSKAIKLRNIPPTPTAGTPLVRLKPRGDPLPRKHGDAYDSEAEDREKDPSRESNVVFRAADPEAAEYLKKAIAEGTIGLPKANGGADFSIQYLDSKERRAFVNINGTFYAAVLVQLPTITEAMKTWDRKSMMKNSDVTEMLLCFAKVANEQEAKTIPLPSMVSKADLKWPHGITPPMHDAANRRFRKTLSEQQYERTQRQVEKLLADDAAAEEVHTELIIDDDEEDDEDAEGELDEDDYFGDVPSVRQDMDVDTQDDQEDEEDPDLVAELEKAFMMETEAVDADTPGTQLEAPTPVTMGVNTPLPAQEEAASDEDEDEEEEISDEDDDDDDEDADDEDRAKDRERKQQLGELNDLQKQLKDAQGKLETTTMVVLKKRLLASIESLKKEIAVKKAALDLTEEE
ncbi:hypothetical protein F5Y18DRAFT_347121 [Xylariaceae sp. FL1019]|nr:hypothetical protein F5Y18DRAFT_347121 [Xylariaceae sp. FL1019]